MGISGNKNILYKSPNLELSHVAEVLLDRVEQKKSSNSDFLTRKPCVDIDANNIGFSKLELASGPAGAVFQIAEIFSTAGIDVGIICDGPSRHPSKRDSVNRRAKRERARLSCLEARASLAALLQQETQPSATRIQELESKIKKFEKEAARVLPAGFASQIESLVERFSCKDGHFPSHGKIIFLSETWQADPLLAARAKRDISDAIVSNDSDFAAHLGSAGLFIKQLKCPARKEPTLTDMVLTCASQMVADSWSKVLSGKVTFLGTRGDTPDADDDTALYHTPKWPIFDDAADAIVDDPMI